MNVIISILVGIILILIAISLKAYFDNRRLMSYNGYLYRTIEAVIQAVEDDELISMLNEITEEIRTIHENKGENENGIN